MTRFWITLAQAVQFVVDSFDLMQGGELYVPRIPSMTDHRPGRRRSRPARRCTRSASGPGEKLHEEMIAPDDGRRTLRARRPLRRAARPSPRWGYEPPPGGEPVPDGFAYRSDTNDQWLSSRRCAR